MCCLYFIDVVLPNCWWVFLQGKKMAGPVLDFPFLPEVNSEKGQRMLQAYAASASGGEVGGVVAHQLCALQIFQARATRSR
jgi:hypothetical protein